LIDLFHQWMSFHADIFCLMKKFRYAISVEKMERNRKFISVWAEKCNLIMFEVFAHINTRGHQEVLSMPPHMFMHSKNTLVCNLPVFFSRHIVKVAAFWIKFLCCETSLWSKGTFGPYPGSKQAWCAFHRSHHPCEYYSCRSMFIFDKKIIWNHLRYLSQMLTVDVRNLYYSVLNI
jgi:hypothetical protein